MQWLKLLENRRSRVRIPLWPSNLKETKYFSPLTCNHSILWGASVTEKYRARPQTAKTRISHHVSVIGRCHLIHLTSLMRFSWSNLAYICTMVHQTPFVLFQKVSICLKTEKLTFVWVVFSLMSDDPSTVVIVKCFPLCVDITEIRLSSSVVCFV